MKTPSPPFAAGSACNRAAYCTTRQAAERLGVSLRTVQKWVENGQLQAWKTAGGHRRIANDSVGRALERRRTRPALPTHGCTGRNVLIVDDDALLLRLYELEIDTWNLGFSVRKACNGIEALARIGEAMPDILVSDLDMPGLDGFGMIRTLRGNPATAGMPLVVVSAMDQRTVLALGLPHDVPYLTKPAPLAALRAAVTALLPSAS